jgi:hypothetical protein
MAAFQKTLNLFFILVCLLITGCSPFGKGSKLNFKNFPSLILSEQTNSDINSGGTTTPSTPASGQPSDIHTVSYKVGSSFSQTQWQTANGHSVSVSGVGSK